MRKQSVKINRASNGDTGRSNEFDRCQTPPYALTPLLPFLSGTVWECAAGEGGLAQALTESGLNVIATDILSGFDFFKWQPVAFDSLVTNPPYSSKFDWLERCYSQRHGWRGRLVSDGMVYAWTQDWLCYDVCESGAHTRKSNESVSGGQLGNTSADTQTKTNRP